MDKKKLGEIGESLAAQFLEEQGYHILRKNYWCKFGEIDLIAQKNNYVHFVEVKTRSGDSYGSPAESINVRKINRLKAAAQSYMKAVAGMPGLGKYMQLDVIEVEVKINHIRNI